MDKRTCSISGCEGASRTRGMCRKHYVRLWRHGSVQDPVVTMPTEMRFWAKVSKTDTCWNWTGHVHQKGYGYFRADGKVKKAHRYAYELLVGSIPDGMQIDHVCHNKACVNPLHLRTATNKQNAEHHSGGAQQNSQSGVRGVWLDKETNRWRVAVGHNGRLIRGGRFDTLEEAEVAAVALRNRLHTRNDADRARA